MTLRFSHLSSITKYLFIFCVIAIIAIPFIVSGQEDAETKGFVTCDGIEVKCTLCHAFKTTHNVMNFLFKVIVLPLTAIVFLIGGILILTSAGNETQVTRGKSILWNTFIGILVAFGAWLVINTVIINITPGIEDGDIKYAGVTIKWYQFPGCIEGTDAPLPGVGGGGGGDDGGGGEDGGTCEVQTSGNCSPESLSSFLAGSGCSLSETELEEASQVCFAESSGVEDAPSGVDICQDGNPFSWGLFQINLTQHQLPNPDNPDELLDCPSAFSAPNSACTVTKQTLYNQSVAAATNANINTKKACELHNIAGSWRPDWTNVSDDCNLP